MSILVLWVPVVVLAVVGLLSFMMWLFKRPD